MDLAPLLFVQSPLRLIGMRLTLAGLTLIAERLPAVTVPRARKTSRLIDALQKTAFIAGGEEGSRLAVANSYWYAVGRDYDLERALAEDIRKGLGR